MITATRQRKLAKGSSLSGDALIPFLKPLGLERVPGWQQRGDEWRGEFFSWRRQVYQLRDEMDEYLWANPEARADEMRLCAQDPAYWLAMWGWIYEPRAVDGEGFEGTRPFVPFAGQVQVIRRFQETMAEQYRDLYVSKSRTWGASWLFAALALHSWLFEVPCDITILSRKEELVDKAYDMNALFQKVDFLMVNLPEWMLPKRWTRKSKLLKNRVTGAQIVGEATSSRSTRGGRATWVLYDECAFMQGFTDVWGTGTGTTFHRVGVSTESFEQGDGWWEAWTSQKTEHPDWVLELDYFHNPSFDTKWEKGERKRNAHNIEKFEVEYMRNPFAVQGFIYPAIKDAPEAVLTWDPDNITLVGMDPGRADDTSLVWGQQIESASGSPGIAWLYVYEKNLMPPEWFAHVATGVDPEPGDVAYADWINQGRWSVTEEEIIQFTRKLPWDFDRVRYFMDPAGQQKHLDHETFHSRFVAETYRLRQRQIERKETTQKLVAIWPLWQELRGNQGQHEHRRVVTRAFLPYSVFNATRGGRRIKECLAKSRFSEPTINATGQPAPVHNKYSHVRSAVEYVYVYMSVGFADQMHRGS